MAIGFDVVTDGSNATATSLTWSHTVTGSNPILYVDVIGDLATDAVTGVTYNSVAMTLVAKSASFGSTRWVYLYGLYAPATGAHNVVVSAGASVFLAGHSISYTGAAQSGTLSLGSNTGSSASAASLSITCAPTVDNSWAIGAIKNDAGAGSAGTATTLRLSTAAGGMSTCDHGPISPAANTTLQITDGTTAWNGVIGVIVPFSGTGNMFLVW